MDYLVGIDLGSTSLKAVVYDLAGNAVARASRPTEGFHPYPEHPDWAIWKPERIWGGVAEASKAMNSATRFLASNSKRANSWGASPFQAANGAGWCPVA